MTTLTLTSTRVSLTLTPANGPTMVLTAATAPRLTLATVGVQGPPGPPADTITTPAMGALSALRVVALAGGGVELVNPASAASLARMIGVTTTAAADGATVTVRQAGTMTDPAWSWIPGQPLFCGAGGALTGTAPTSVACRQVGVAVDATTILIDPSDLIILE